MLKHTVLVQITGAIPFRAEVELDVDALNAHTPPPNLTGTFTSFDGYESICKALVQTDRFDGGSSHTMYFFVGRHGYRLITMAASDSERFEAVALWSRRVDCRVQRVRANWLTRSKCLPRLDWTG